MSALLAAIWPSKLVDRLIVIFAVAFVVIMVVVAGYLHFENTQKRLVKAAETAAKAQVVEQVQEKSAELQRQNARVQAGAIVELQQTSSAAASEAEDVQAQIQSITEPKAPSQPAPTPTPSQQKEDTHVAAPDPELVKAIDAINRDNDAVDGMLESASRSARRKR